MDAAVRFSPATHREPRLPLVLGAVTAILLHALLIPAALWRGNVTLTSGDVGRVDTAQAPPPPPQDDTAGQRESSVSSVAWIAYDDFQQLIAPQSQVEQPALQQMEEPVPQAPAELDPTPPAPTAMADQAAAAAAEPIAALTPRPAASPAPPPLPLPAPQMRGEIPFSRLDPAPTSQTPEPAPPAPADAAPAAAAAAQARPTSSPRSDREAPPASLREPRLEVRPGRVIARQGFEVKTFAPRFSAVTLASTLPRNPTATLTFDDTGQVTQVVLDRSSGASNVDGPVIASLYRWRASGPRIDQAGEAGVTLEVTLLLVGR